MMKALVVDDEFTTRTLLQEMLASLAEVDSCGDGTEAVEACSLALQHGTPYDLICMDIMMPNMNGLDALGVIRQAEESHGISRVHSAKVIVTTAAGDTETIEKAFTGLCDAYITKPIDAEELLNLVYCLCPVGDASA